jgi:hypothetical protein
MRSFLSKSVDEFHAADNSTLLLELINSSGRFDIHNTQKRAWEAQIEILKDIMPKSFPGRLLFEFQIPRVGRRVDVCIVTTGPIFVLEFKLNAQHYNSADKDQTIDYALDLKNFHSTSYDRKIIPVLIATEAPTVINTVSFHDDGVADLCLANKDSLRQIIDGFGPYSKPTNALSLTEWQDGRYKPTPTIIEAAKAMYEGHSIEEISRSEAGAQNLSATHNYVQNIIHQTKATGEKAICFITGVPGSGKTLAGLNIAARTMEVSAEKTGAVFLSGNGPLVDVLQEALARNQVEQAAETGKGIKIGAARRRSRSFVQIIHRWRDEYLQDHSAPEERIVVFDEAQRAWTAEQTSTFMQTKKGQADFQMSEPEFLLSVMERHSGWCVVVCLIGGGQEINKGEAGIDEWLKAASESTVDWQIHVSDRLTERDTFGGLPDLTDHSTRTPALHLSTSIRSFRAEALSDFVASVLEGDTQGALELGQRLSDYPIKLTRDLSEARSWVKSKARGSERFGLVASSNAMRLKPIGLNLKAAIDPTNWFLNGKDDVRSSYALEDAATEFDVQGLELDWVCMCWDANFVRQNNDWMIRRFSGTRWQQIAQEDKRKYVLNSYRVLLTRARQGMIIFVPRGADEDHTRKPEWYDQTFDYLQSCLG